MWIFPLTHTDPLPSPLHPRPPTADVFTLLFAFASRGHPFTQRFRALESGESLEAQQTHAPRDRRLLHLFPLDYSQCTQRVSWRAENDIFMQKAVV